MATDRNWNEYCRNQILRRLGSTTTTQEDTQTSRTQSQPHRQNVHTCESISGISARKLTDAVERPEQLLTVIGFNQSSGT